MKYSILLLLAAALTPHTQAALVASWNQDDASGNILNSAGGPDGVLVTGGSVDYSQPGVPNSTYGSITVSAAAGTSIGYGPSASDDYFVAGATNSVLGMGAPGSSFTVMSWINPSAPAAAATYRPLSAGGALGTDRGWGFGLRLNNTAGTGSAIRFTTYGIADNDSALFDVALNQWSHLAVTYSNGAINYYLNGNLLGGSDTSVFGPYGASSRLSIGGRIGAGAGNTGGNDADQVNGLLDGVRIYDTVLSEADIRAFAAQSVSVPEPAAASFGLAALALCLRRRRA